jgi:hypothetical protein
MEEEVVYFMVDRKQRVRKGLRMKYNLQNTPTVTYFLQLSPTS